MKPIVEMRNIKKTFRVGKVDVQAVRGVDMAVEPGEFVAIVGPSGCGKSTMLHMLGGLLTPSSGEIYVDGTNLAVSSDAQRTEIRRRKIGFVFQRFNLFPAVSAYDNIHLARSIHGPGGMNEEEEAGLLSMLGLSDKMKHKPLELSGGEQQRVALARAVVNRPAVLLADEPTGNLDSENSEAVLRMLQDLNKRYGQTILMITHNAEAAACAGRIVTMRDGRIVSSRSTGAGVAAHA